MCLRVVPTAMLVSMLGACVATPPPVALRSLSGAELYGRLCASCHGAEGLGDGPVAPLIKGGVPDLTRIAARTGGTKFPTEDVHRIIDGRSDRPAHGPRDMPVWGWRLHDISNPDYASERAQTASMIDRLVSHLQSIQRP